MRKTLGWTLVAVLLVSVPAAAQDLKSTSGGWQFPSLDKLEDLPILGWIVGLIIDGDETDEPLAAGPVPPSADSLDEGTDTQARGGFEPEG